EGTAKPLVLDSVRWLGYLAAHIHNLPLTPPPAQIFPPALYYIADLLYSILTRKTNDKPIYAG
ncbi:MAG: hypothetical protein ACLTAO_12990, partial [Christensenellales bacterium]